MRVYATCLCLAQVALTTPLAFEQPGMPLLDVDPPLPLGGGSLGGGSAGFHKRPPPPPREPPAEADWSADTGSFSDRGIAVLLDDDADLPPPRLRLPYDRAAPGGGAGAARGPHAVDHHHMRAPAPGADASRELVDVDGVDGDGARTISPLSIEMKVAGDGAGANNRSYTLKSYVDRRTMQHQRVMFVKSKVRELLKHNSTSSRTMQPAPPSAAAAMPPPPTAMEGATDGDRPAAYADSAAVSAGSAAGAQADGYAAALDARGGPGWNQQQQQQLHALQQQQTLAVERQAIAAPCVQDQGSPGDWRSTHVNVPIVPTSTSVHRVVAASLSLYFQARPSENKTGLLEEKLTVLLQQTVPCGRMAATPGVRRLRRVVGHMRVPESFVGHVRFNLNRVLSSCVESGGKSRWLIVSVLNSTGHLINAKDFFNAGPCSEGDAFATAQENTASRSSEDANASKSEETRNWKPGESADLGSGSADKALPKHYVEMTVALKRTP